MDRLEAMGMLATVVDEGSFSGAARKLRIPLSTLSRKVADLEAQLGAKLLSRTTRSLSLTDSGTEYLRAARGILEQVEEAELRAAGEFMSPKGEIVVTAPISFGRLHVLPVVTEFLAGFPDINVRLLLSDRNLHLLDEHVDIAVRIGNLPDSSLAALRLGSTRRVVGGSPDLFERHGTPREPRDLRSFPAISFEPLDAVDAWSFRQGEGARMMDVPIAARLSVSSADAALEAATRSVGVVRLFHYQCAAAVRDGSLRIVLADFEPEPLPVQALHAPRRDMPLKARAFLEFASERIKRRMGELG